MNYYDSEAKLQSAIKQLQIAIPGSYCVANRELIWCSLLTPTMRLSSQSSPHHSQNETVLSFSSQIGLMIFNPTYKPRIWIGNPYLFSQIKSSHPELDTRAIYQDIVNNRLDYIKKNELEEFHDYCLITQIVEDTSTSSILPKQEMHSIDNTDSSYFLALQPIQLIEVLFINRICNDII